MKKYKTKLKYDFMEALVEIADSTIKLYPVETDDDRLFIAGLAEARSCLYKRLENYRLEYTVSFTPVQAFALRLLHAARRILNPYTANRLRQISDEVHKHYS